MLFCFSNYFVFPALFMENKPLPHRLYCHIIVDGENDFCVFVW